ncbi:metal-dependent hydrolase [Aestuariibius sp. 2305UL40-4]|uniref:metal-dependent hydrolase n=1 Tax=Aestuariibius violaceus TaxID=3234132 RepID=UPI00345E7B55
MKIIWLGHSGFRIEIEDQILLVDPWLTGNPSFPEDRRAEAIQGATAILLTHAHGDHAGNVLAIAKETGAPVVGMFDLIEWWQHTEKITGLGFNKGGTTQLGGTSVTMVNAVHSSTLDFDDRPARTGSEVGYILRGEGHRIYITGDTDVMADMGIIAERYDPDIGLLCCGGHFTMDMEGAAYAAKKFFDFKTIIPCHWGTFPILAQSPQPLIEALPDIHVIEPQVLVPIEI